MRGRATAGGLQRSGAEPLVWATVLLRITNVTEKFAGVLLSTPSTVFRLFYE